jgi:hypothetical protein
MPHIELLKKGATQDKAKRTTSTPPGGGRPRRVKLATRDPRAGHHGPKVKAPNPAYGR